MTSNAQQKKTNPPTERKSSAPPQESTKQNEKGSSNDKPTVQSQSTEREALPINSAGTKKSESAIQPVKRIWRVGATIRGGGRAATNIKVTFPVPTDWPEQHVNLYKENIPSETRSADFRTSDGVKQMVAVIPRLERGVQIDINVLMEITVKGIDYPDRTNHLVIPKRPPRDIRLNLNPSPLIESRDRNIRKKVKELVDKDSHPWEQARAIYDFAVNEIEMDKNSDVLGARAALKQSKGAPEDRSNLFIALCRCNKIPARTVWADGGEYAEFYLQDDAGAGKWYPVVLDRDKEFGKMSKPRVIIQKGDNIKVPESGQRQRLIVETITGNMTAGAQPRVRFLRDLLPGRDSK